MPRPRSPNRKKAHEIWLASGGKLSNKEIGKQLGVSADMVGKWKRQDNWEQKRQNDQTEKTKNDQTTRAAGQRKHNSYGDRGTKTSRIFSCAI